MEFYLADKIFFKAILIMHLILKKQIYFDLTPIFLNTPVKEQEQSKMSDKPPAIPKTDDPRDLGFKRQPMTRWFKPSRLLELAGKVLVSGAFGTYMDKREIQSALSTTKTYDFSKKTDGFWLDYTADLGDGWSSTYTVAKILAQEQLQTTPDIVTQRGDVLVMGGDQVYPYASKELYRDRLVGPYQSALPWLEGNEQPKLFAIPGNHDWFDGLTSFLRLFCQERWIGAWKTCQSRSYFALKLPHDWWLLGVDIQLETDIDRPQRDYFEEVIEQLGTDSKVIIATAVPSWINESITDSKTDSNLTYLRKLIDIKGAEVHINIAGDLHHYMRYENNEEQRHKITSGGGGAFLHGTQAMPNELELYENGSNRKYKRDDKSIYPSPATSRKTTRNTLLFPCMNPGFSFFIGAFYLITLWIMQNASGTLSSMTGTNNLLIYLSGIKNIPLCEALEKFTAVIIHSPASIILLLILFAGMWGFAEPPVSKKPRVQNILRFLLSFIHASAHTFNIFILGTLFSWFNLVYLEMNQVSFSQVTLFIFEVIAIGGLIAGLLIGIYLIIVNNLFNFNREAAFSSNRIKDYKNFCRFHIDANGNLTIYPIGINKIETDWKINSKGKDGDTWFVTPNSNSMDEYTHLIEEPIHIKR